MDSLQIQDLVKNDPYLKTKTCKIIYESEIPTQIDKDIILFVLIPNGQIKQKENKVRYALGHWCLIDTLKSVHHPRKCTISYWDPYGIAPSPSTFKKIAGTASAHNLRVFINRKQTQLKVSTICGPIICYISLMKSRGFSNSQILQSKLSTSDKINAKVLPDMINSLLSKNLKKVTRFSIDIL